MEPQYRFCLSADGTRISFSTLGEGRRTPVINVGIWMSVQEGFWQSSGARAVDWALAQDRCVVAFDRRGMGASQRDVEDLSLEAHVADLRAVAGQLGVEQIDLVGVLEGNAVVIAYAAAYPEQVRRLVLWHPFVRGADVWDAGQARSLTELIRSNWELATRTIASVVAYPSGPAEAQRRFAKLLRGSVSPDVAARYTEFQVSVDVSAALHHVRARTLIVCARGSQHVPVRAARAVSELIPDARLIVLGNAGASGEQQLEVLREFLDDSTAAAEIPSGTAIILFADIADSTALTERLGDAAFRDKARELDEALRRAIESNGGTAIEGKLLGDGVLAVFGAAREAIACAGAIHGMAGSRVEGRGSRANDEPLLLHIGIHAGDVIREEGNVYGGAVNIASRVASEAAAGETLVSGTVRDLARTSAGVSFEDRGERELKGVSEAVRLFAVRQD
jgi:class 3 adenylate cyclase